MSQQSQHVIFEASSLHPDAGPPPCITTAPGRYYGYFEDENASQHVFVYEMATGNGFLHVGNDFDQWNKRYPVVNGLVESVTLPTEASCWLKNCWESATGKKIEESWTAPLYRMMAQVQGSTPKPEIVTPTSCGDQFVFRAYGSQASPIPATEREARHSYYEAPDGEQWIAKATPAPSMLVTSSAFDWLPLVSEDGELIELPHEGELFRPDVPVGLWMEYLWYSATGVWQHELDNAEPLPHHQWPPQPGTN